MVSCCNQFDSGNEYKNDLYNSRSFIATENSIKKDTKKERDTKWVNEGTYVKSPL